VSEREVEPICSFVWSL